MKPRGFSVFLMKEELAMTSVPQQAEALQRILEEEAVPLAKETGFIERERAFTGTLLTREFFWIQSNRPVCCQIRGEEVSSALRRMARGQYFPRQQSTGRVRMRGPDAGKMKRVVMRKLSSRTIKRESLEEIA